MAAGSAVGEPAADCALCPPLRFRFNEMAGLPGADAVVAGDDDFFLMPDLAPLGAGHALLVTAAHHPCAGAFSPRLWAAARRWLRLAGRIYARAYGRPDVAVLEHGPGTPQGGGSCIDHAHWHLLPGGAGGIRAVVEDHGLRGAPAAYRTLRDLHAAGGSYLLVGELVGESAGERGEGRVYPGDGAPGQFLRWAAATALSGRPAAVWRWQEQFGLPASRKLFSRTLADLRAGVSPGGPGTGPRAGAHLGSHPGSPTGRHPGSPTGSHTGRAADSHQ